MPANLSAGGKIIWWGGLYFPYHKPSRAVPHQNPALTFYLQLALFFCVFRQPLFLPECKLLNYLASIVKARPSNPLSF